MGGISVGVDVGGTFTDLVAAVDGELVTAKVPSVPGAEARGIAAALAAAGVERGRGGRARARDDRGDERVARAPRRPDGARHDRGLPRRDRDRPAGPGVPLRPDRAQARSARTARAALHRARTDGARGRRRPARRRVAAGGRRGRRRRGGRGGRGLPAVLVPAPGARAGGRRRAARRVAGRARFALVRVAARVPGVRALLDHCGERVPGARAVGVPGGDRAAAARHAVLGRGGRRGLGGRAAGFVRPLGAGGGSRRSGVRRGRRRLRGRAHLRHGRDEHRRRGRPRGRGAGYGRVGGRGRPDPVPDGRRAHDRRRRRLDRVARRRRRAAGRAPFRGSASRPRLLRPGRRGGDGHRRESRPRLPGRRGRPRRRGEARPSPGRRSVGASTCGRVVTQTFQPRSQRLGGERHELGRGRKGHRGRRRGRSGRRGRDGSGAPRGQRRARDRSARAGAGRLRRRRATACLRAGRGAGDGSRPRSAGLGNAQRAGPRGGRSPARLRRRLLRGDGGSGRTGPAGGGHAAARRRALPGAIARADRRRRGLGVEAGRGARAPLRVPARRRARDRHTPAGCDPPASSALPCRAGHGRVRPPAVARTSTAGGSTFPSTSQALPSRARRSSSCPARHVSYDPAGRESPTRSGRSSWSDRGPGDALGDERRPRRDRRGDGHGPRPQRVLLEHQGAARLLGRALRRGGTHGRPGGAHPGPSRGDARVGRPP